MSDPWQTVRTQALHHGTVVRTIREARGLSQSKLVMELDPHGEWTEVTIPNVSRWENGSMIPSSAIATIIHQWVLQHSPQSDPIVPTPARHSDPETSHRNAPSTNTQVHWAICDIIRMYPTGLADFQIAGIYNVRAEQWPEQYPPVTEQRLRTARAELVTANRISDSGLTIPNQRDRACTVWKYNPATGTPNA